ncbi:hypothetical protein TNCV_1138901 [Trichonephila clavipes]|nr:hypothetical protein TNCV_1138901 [Trichonephila clavipes]
MNETTQQEKTTQLSSRNEQLNSVAGTKQLNSPVGTKQLNSALLSTAYNRLQPPATAYNAYNRLQPPATACNRLQPPTTAYNRLQPPATTCNRLQPPAPPLQQNRLFLPTGVEEHIQCRLLFSLFQDFPEVINSIVVVKIPNPTDISLVWVPF